MSPDRKVVKEWLKTVDREELDAMLQAAIFTPDELKYIKQSANFNLSQVLQTSAIVGQLHPFPQPAYIAASPYQALTGYGLCRCSTGTGTGTATT